MPVPSQSQTFVLRDDHTFSPSGGIMHKSALEQLLKLLEKAKNRDPDVFNMYIYNDFFGYALLDLVDKSLSSINTSARKKKWVDSWNGLVAVTLLMDRLGDWTQVDDGDRVEATDKCYGALLVSTIKGLDTSEPSLFNEDTFQDLEKSLAAMASWGDAMNGLVGSKYNKVIKGYGKRLFGTRTDEERKARFQSIQQKYTTFYNGLSEAERTKKGYLKPRTPGEKEAEKDEDDEDDDEEEDDGSWFGKAKDADADFQCPDFKINPAWKEYKAYLAGCPQKPLRGPPQWDLSKWSAAARKQFSHGFDEDSEDDGMPVFF